MSRAERRRTARRLSKSKFSTAERKALCEKFSTKIDPLELSDVELLKMRHVLAAAQRESEQAYDALLRTNDLPFSDPANFPRIAMVFAPVERVLDEMVANGHMDADESGQPLLFNQADGVWYPIVPALVSMCDTYSKLAGEYSWSDETDGMRKFTKRLELAMPIFQEDVDRARATINWMKQQTLHITPNQFSREIQEIQIRDEAVALGLVQR